MVELATTQSPLLGATSFVLTSLITIFSTNLKSISIKEEDGSDEDDGEEFDSSDEECFASSPLVDNWGLADAPYKLVLIVNMSLKMGKGKVCAQCCHAAVGCYKRGRVMKPSGVKWWERTGCAKVAVKVRLRLSQSNQKQLWNNSLTLLTQYHPPQYAIFASVQLKMNSKKSWQRQRRKAYLITSLRMLAGPKLPLAVGPFLAWDPHRFQNLRGWAITWSWCDC